MTDERIDMFAKGFAIAALILVALAAMNVTHSNMVPSIATTGMAIMGFILGVGSVIMYSISHAVSVFKQGISMTMMAILKPEAMEVHVVKQEAEELLRKKARRKAEEVGE